MPPADAPKRVDSEMPRLKRFLKVTVLTWLPMVAIASGLGGIDMARTLKDDYVGSFLGGTIWFFEIVALPSLFIVATYVLAALPVRTQGTLGVLIRIALAMAAATLVIGVMAAVALLTTDNLSPWLSIRSAYQPYLVEALFLAPVLVFVHGRIK